MRQYKVISFFVISLILFLVEIISQAFGFGSELCLPEGLTIQGYLKNETYLRLSGTPDHVMSCRNIANFDISYYTPQTIPIVRRIFVQLRPFYDASFAMGSNQDGGGDGGGQHIITLPPLQGRHMREKFQDNFGVADDWDPLLRECWADIQIGNRFYGRLGRQLVSWGRSDGIHLLDMINPINYRNWSVFDEEDTKIPNWIVNLTYSFSAFDNLQLLVIPRYIPNYTPSGGHDWAPNVVKVVREYYADPGSFFGMPGAWGQVVLKNHEPDPGDPNDWAYGVRWGGAWKDLNYSLNYLYTWNFNPSDWNLDATELVKERSPNRLTIIGGSFDYQFTKILGLENLVVRGEAAYFQHDIFVDGNFENHKKQHFDYMLGFDKFFFGDWWWSLQVKQTWILNPPTHRATFLSVASRLKELVTIPGVITYPVAQGYVDRCETQISLYVMKDFLPGKFLKTDTFLLWTSEGDWWFRPRVKYEWTKKFHTSFGYNFYWALNKYSTFGEFYKNDNVFFEFKYDF